MENNRSCPICGTYSSEASIFMRRNIDLEQMSDFSFSSRKQPEFMCHQLVKCPTCDLVYANDPPDQSVLAQAYHTADFDSAQEADDAAVAYDKAIAPIIARLRQKKAALEIGTGTGIFLEKLKDRGFENVVGVEPSASAIAAAPVHRRDWIRECIFKESDFQPKSFDFICCFMTLEHVVDPNEIVSAASNLLRPGGAIALVTHNYRGVVNRVLGKRSPIIDVEHMQLFSPASLKSLLRRNSFENIEVDSFYNKYSLRYWVRLLPIGTSFKVRIIGILGRIGLAEQKISLNVGNILSYGFISGE